MLIHEYRIIMPLSVEEYNLAQLFAISEMSKHETGGGEGIEIVKNEPFENHFLGSGKYSSGQYSLKIYHVKSKMPTLLRLILPGSCMQVYEECWNAYPYSKSVLTNPGYMKDGFELVVESLHCDDRGDQHNVLQLPPDILKKREVTVIDIANDSVNAKDYDPRMDPKSYRSVKTGRGPLTGDWMESADPVMTCYKLVTVNFKWFGLQNRVEKTISNFNRRVFTVFNRRVFCSIDGWYGLTMDDIRRIEMETKDILDEARLNDPLKGTRSSTASMKPLT